MGGCHSRDRARSHRPDDSAATEEAHEAGSEEEGPTVDEAASRVVIEEASEVETVIEGEVASGEEWEEIEVVTLDTEDRAEDGAASTATTAEEDHLRWIAGTETATHEDPQGLIGTGRRLVGTGIARGRVRGRPRPVDARGRLTRAHRRGGPRMERGHPLRDAGVLHRGGDEAPRRGGLAEEPGTGARRLLAGGTRLSQHALEVESGA